MRNRIRTGLAAACCALLLVVMPGAGAESRLTADALANWLEAYGAAWESRDADAAAALFTPDATYQVTPWEEPHAGTQAIHDYWAGVTENQRNVAFTFEVLAVTGNTGIAHWSAAFDVAPDGAHLKLDGMFVLEFAPSGKCRSLREWWHLQSNSDQ